MDAEEEVEDEVLPPRQWAWVDLSVVLFQVASDFATAFGRAFENLEQSAAMHANWTSERRERAQFADETLQDIERVPVADE